MPARRAISYSWYNSGGMSGLENVVALGAAASSVMTSSTCADTSGLCFSGEGKKKKKAALQCSSAAAAAGAFGGFNLVTVGGIKVETWGKSRTPVLSEVFRSKGAKGVVPFKESHIIVGVSFFFLLLEIKSSYICNEIEN